MYCRTGLLLLKMHGRCDLIFEIKGMLYVCIVCMAIKDNKISVRIQKHDRDSPAIHI